VEARCAHRRSVTLDNRQVMPVAVVWTMFRHALFSDSLQGKSAGATSCCFAISTAIQFELSTQLDSRCDRLLPLAARCT
jgi:hypothetical protein